MLFQPPSPTPLGQSSSLMISNDTGCASDTEPAGGVRMAGDHKASSSPRPRVKAAHPGGGHLSLSLTPQNSMRGAQERTQNVDRQNKKYKHESGFVGVKCRSKRLPFTAVGSVGDGGVSGDVGLSDPPQPLSSPGRQQPVVEGASVRQR